MPSETDPLLPQGNSAPEIVGYGFSKSYQAQSQSQDHDDNHEALDDGRKKYSYTGDGNASPLRTIFALFTAVVGAALIIVLIVGGLHLPEIEEPKHGNPATTKARVDKILSETPLIGHRTSFQYGETSV